jgi:hypothetical protein
MLRNSEIGSDLYIVSRYATIKGFELVLGRALSLMRIYVKKKVETDLYVNGITCDGILRRTTSSGFLTHEENERWCLYYKNTDITICLDYCLVDEENALKQVDGLLCDATVFAEKIDALNVAP